MAETDIFLQPLGGESPSGVDLRNEMAFQAIERKLAPAHREARNPEAAEEAAPADWTGILADAAELAEQGRDLRLLVIVARALTNTDGFDGFAQGLQLISETLGRFWDSVHPALRDDPDPRTAALRRINALRQIESRTDGILGDLELNVVFAARGLGPVTGGDLAAGEMSAHKMLTEAPTGLGQREQDELVARHEERVARVRAAARALAAEESERMAALRDSLARAEAALDALETALATALGQSNGQGVRFGDLRGLLQGVAATLENAASYADAAPEGDADAEAGAVTEPGTDDLTGATAGAPRQIRSREDVLRSLDGIIAFYDRTEPASPIPHLARRMRRMVPMNFMELMSELAPSGIKEFRNVAGLTDDKTK